MNEAPNIESAMPCETPLRRAASKDNTIKPLISDAEVGKKRFRRLLRDIVVLMVMLAALMLGASHIDQPLAHLFAFIFFMALATAFMLFSQAAHDDAYCPLENVDIAKLIETLETPEAKEILRLWLDEQTPIREINRRSLVERDMRIAFIARHQARLKKESAEAESIIISFKDEPKGGQIRQFKSRQSPSHSRPGK